MHEKYKNDLSNHYLRSLFTYKIEDLNHESLINYSNGEVKCEVERIIKSRIEDKPNHVITKFFNKWNETRSSASGVPTRSTEINRN